MKSMKVRLRDTLDMGDAGRFPPGRVVELDEAFARTLVKNGAAEELPAVEQEGVADLRGAKGKGGKTKADKEVDPPPPPPPNPEV